MSSIFPPYKKWYEYGPVKGPGILYRRIKQRRPHPIFRTRMMWQRARRGYSVEDCWSLDHHVARIIVGGVGNLRKWAHGYPLEVGSPEEWDAILARIEAGFQAWLDCDGWFHGSDDDEAKFKNAAGLFGQWFGALWD